MSERRLRTGDRVKLRGIPYDRVIGRVVLVEQVETGLPGGFEAWSVRGGGVAHVHPGDALPAIYR